MRPHAWRSKKIDQALAQELEKFKGGLGFEGLTTVDNKLASILANFEAETFVLEGLTAIDNDAAQELVSFKGKFLWLGGIQSLNKGLASQLIAFKSILYLTGMTQLNKETAEQFVKKVRQAVSLLAVE